ncbi:TMEM175 family protein [Geodermatophilus sp. SYSU D00758]
MGSDRGLDRLVTFMDAVVAIAITLLVLPLVDVLPQEAAGVGLGALLAEEAARFGAFALSFVVIARLWLAHHRHVERVGAYDRAFLAVNLGWTLTVVLLPFTTQVVAVYGPERGAVALYIGTLALSSAFLTASSVLVWRRPGLRRAGTAPEELRPAPALVTTGWLLIALLVGVLVPDVNYFALFLLFLSGPVIRLAMRRPVRVPA